MVLEANKAEDQRRKLTIELEKVGLRLNKRAPDVQISLSKSGGVKVSTTLKLTKIDEKLIKNIF